MKTLKSLLELARDEQEERGLLHTPREISQQPLTWTGTLSIFCREQQRICSFLEDIGLRGSVKERPTVFLVGAGSSDYIGQALAPLLRRLWQTEVMACGSTDLLPNLPDYLVEGKKYLWISVSRSGDSPEAVALIQHAIEQHPDIAHLILTCNSEAKMVAMSKLHSRSFCIVLDDAVNDRSLAMTSSFTNMLLMGHCLAHAWSLDTYLPLVEQLVQAGDDLLDTGFPAAEKLAAERFGRVCFVGSGALVAVAKESALKVLEMSAGQVKTMAESTLGLRHGPMAALDSETLFVCFASSRQPRQAYAADLLRELGRKRVIGKRVVIGPAAAYRAFAPHCEVYIPLSLDVQDIYRPVIDVIFGQLLGLSMSIEYGCRPDAPSSGNVITRVVEQFAIYR